MTDADKSMADPTRSDGDIGRLRALAAALPGTSYTEVHLNVDYARVRDLLADMPAELPHLIRTVRSFRMVAGTPRHGHALAVGVIGNRATFELRMRPGWCLMQSALIIGGFAAAPDGDGTRFAVLAGLRPRMLRPAHSLYWRLVGRWRMPHLTRRVERRAAQRRPTS